MAETIEAAPFWAKTMDKTYVTPEGMSASNKCLTSKKQSRVHLGVRFWFHNE